MDNQSRIALVRVGEAFPGNGSADKPVQYHLGDHLGSSYIVIGGATAATATEFMNREEYFPYGETSFGSFAKKRYRYTGKERDEESGLYYHGARYYAPWLLRWTAVDPAGAIDGANLYAYVRSNPISFMDSSGLAAEDERPKTLGGKGEENFEKRLDAKGTEYTPEATSESGISRTDFKKELGPDVELKTRNLANWRKADKALDVKAIREFETASLLQNAKHVLDTGEKETLLYQLLNASSSDVAEYRKIVTELKHDLVKELRGNKPLRKELQKLVDDTGFSRKELRSALKGSHTGLGVTTWEKVSRSTKAISSSNSISEAREIRNYSQFRTEVRAGRITVTPALKKQRLVPSFTGALAGIASCLIYLEQERPFRAMLACSGVFYEPADWIETMLPDDPTSPKQWMRQATIDWGPPPPLQR